MFNLTSYKNIHRYVHIILCNYLVIVPSISDITILSSYRHLNKKHLQ